MSRPATRGVSPRRDWRRGPFQEAITCGSPERGCTTRDEQPLRRNGGQLSPVIRFELGQERRHVRLDGARCDIQDLGNGLVGTSFCHQRQHFTFARADEVVDSRDRASDRWSESRLISDSATLERRSKVSPRPGASASTEAASPSLSRATATACASVARSWDEQTSMWCAADGRATVLKRRRPPFRRTICSAGGDRTGQPSPARARC